MKSNLYCFPGAAVLTAAIIFSSSQTGRAQEETDQEASEEAFYKAVEEFGWVREGKGELKNRAQIEIPEGFRFTNGDGAAQLMMMYGNLESGREQGLIAPENLEWCVLFEFDSSGYVKDDDKDELDADKLLKTMQKNQEAANEYRRENGLSSLTLTGWAYPPNYNEETNNLEWALNLADSEGGETVNFNTRLLGRRGVMEAVLICNPEQLDSILPEYEKLLAGYDYKSGERYADYQKGDRVAKYGLAALVVGGGAAAAAKLGLFGVIGKFFAKFFKIIILGVLAIGAALSKMLGFRRHKLEG